MVNFIYGMPNILLCVLINMLSMTISIIAVCLVQRYISLSARLKNDAAMSRLNSTFCVLYSLMVGIISLYTLNNYNKAETISSHEASLIAEIYRDSQFIQNPTRTVLQGEINDYLRTIINHEWPEMKKGNVIFRKGGPAILNNIFKQLHEYHAKTQIEIFTVQSMLQKVNELYQVREARIFLTNSALSMDAWLVILVGAILTIGINYFYAMRFSIHLLSIIFVSIIVSSSVYFILVLDRPFRGELSVKPTAFEAVSTMINYTAR